MRLSLNVNLTHYPGTACRIGIVVSFGVRHCDECSEHSFFRPAISFVQFGGVVPNVSHCLPFFPKKESDHVSFSVEINHLHM